MYVCMFNFFTHLPWSVFKTTLFLFYKQRRKSVTPWQFWKFWGRCLAVAYFCHKILHLVAYFSQIHQKFWWKISIASLFQIKSMKQLEKVMLSHKSLRSYDPLSIVITKHMQCLLIWNDYLLLNTFLAVA